MPMSWDADADARLFAAVLATSEVKIDYPAVALKMGNGCTAKAITHRITNIKNKAKSLETDGAAAVPAAPAGANSRKRGRQAKNSQDTSGEEKPAAKKQKATNGANAGVGGARAKNSNAPVAPSAVKKDDDDDDDDDAGDSEEDVKGED